MMFLQAMTATNLTAGITTTRTIIIQMTLGATIITPVIMIPATVIIQTTIMDTPATVMDTAIMGDIVPMILAEADTILVGVVDVIPAVAAASTESSTH